MIDSNSTTTTRYALSFGAGALLVRQGSLLAPIYLEEGDWERTRARSVERNILQTRTHSSGVRLARETLNRLSALTDDEIELLVEASAAERAHLMWTAACRRYTFIGDFAAEVMRERFLLLTPALGHNEFDSFVHGKTLWHPELAELKESTLRKLRSTVFRMLIEADLLADGEIVPVTLSQRVRDHLDARTPSDLRFFPTRDGQEIPL